MKAKFLAISMLVVLLGLVAGCHSGDDRWSGYGDGGSYRDGFRDGRVYERRRETGSGWGWASDTWSRVHLSVRVIMRGSRCRRPACKPNRRAARGPAMRHNISPAFQTRLR